MYTYILSTIATNIIGDPHFVVPLLSKKILCYSIQGYPGLTFNLIYNKNFVINAQFINSINDSTEATWIGELAVISQTKSKSDAIIFSSVDQNVTIVDKGTFKAKMIKQIIFTRNSSIKLTQHVKIPSGNPTLHVIFDELQANFDIKFYKNHLNVDWKIQYDELPDIHGLMGKIISMDCICIVLKCGLYVYVQILLA